MRLYDRQDVRLRRQNITVLSSVKNLPSILSSCLTDRLSSVRPIQPNFINGAVEAFELINGLTSG